MTGLLTQEESCLLPGPGRRLLSDRLHPTYQHFWLQNDLSLLTDHAFINPATEGSRARLGGTHYRGRQNPSQWALLGVSALH